MSRIKLYLVRAIDTHPESAAEPIHCTTLFAYSAADAIVQWQVQQAARRSTVATTPMTIEPIDEQDERLDPWRDADHEMFLKEGARPDWYQEMGR